MEIIVKASDLKSAFSKIGFLKRKGNLPVLGYAKLSIVKHIATLQATDMEMAVSIEVPCDSKQDDTILLPRTYMTHFLSDNTGEIKISQGKLPAQVNIKKEQFGESTITVPKQTDFPLIPFADKLDWHAIDGKWFCNMLNIISTACSNDSNRLILMGIVFSDGAIASTDGFRLYVLKDTRLNFGLNDKRVVINKIAIKAICQLFSKEKTIDVAFETSKLPQDPNIRRIYVKNDRVLFMSEAMQGTFPNYEQLIPKSFICRASFSAPLMSQRLNMIDEKQISGGITKFIFNGVEQNGEPQCSIRANLTTELEGDYNFSMPVKLEGQPAKIAIQINYVKTALKYLSVCNFEISNTVSPAKLTGDIEGLTIVIMPMYVQW